MARTEMRRSAVASTRADGATVKPKPLPRQSAKRKALQPARVRCVADVLARDGACVADGIPNVPHDHAPGVMPRSAQCHELRRGQMRAVDFTRPEWCLTLCEAAHTFVTRHPTDAQAWGLALPSWATDPGQAYERRILAGGIR